MANTIIKVMYWAVDIYSLLIGTVMTWNETLVNKYPKTMGFITGVGIGAVLLK